MCAFLHANGCMHKIICLCTCVCIYVYICGRAYIFNMWMILVCGCINACVCKYIYVFDHTCVNVCVDRLIIIIIMVIFKCYFSGELIALSYI